MESSFYGLLCLQEQPCAVVLCTATLLSEILRKSALQMALDVGHLGFQTQVATQGSLIPASTLVV